MNLTCNSTLEDLRISPGSEEIIIGSLNFHDLARIIGAACTLIATVLSLYLIWQHALHYTRPREQRQIIRILFMVPIYAISSLLQIIWYWHAIYFQVISDCYEAFAIASFFALLCHYIAPDLHSQKEFFRALKPIKPWVLPINWFAKCCGGQRGIWRTPKSGLTWFNIIWIGIYHYCFIRVAMTVLAVILEKFDKYCETSNYPVFGHIWVIVINAAAVTIAMYCVIQFYVQLRESLAEHKPFLKVVAIKLVIFLSFWQASAISVGTSTLKIVHPNAVVAYPDLKVGIPALLLCFEMAVFAVLHLWAFPYHPYRVGAPTTFYPVPDPSKASPSVENANERPSGGPLGLAAIWDALNIWDFVKAFGRGMRWLVCGVKRRKEDKSYKLTRGNTLDMTGLATNEPSSYEAMRPAGAPGQTSGIHADDTACHGSGAYRPSPYDAEGRTNNLGEDAGLISHAAPNPEARLGTPSRPPRPDDTLDYDGYLGASGRQDTNPYRDTSPYRPGGQQQPPSYASAAPPPLPHGFPQQQQQQQSRFQHRPTPEGHHAASSSYTDEHDVPVGGAVPYPPQSSYHPVGQHDDADRTDAQRHVGEALWGPR